MKLSETQNRVAEIREGMSLLSRHLYNVADAVNQLQGQQAIAKQALREDLTSDGLTQALADIASHCPSGETVEQWRVDSEDMTKRLTEKLGLVSEELQKLVDIESTRIRHGGEGVS